MNASPEPNLTPSRIKPIWAVAGALVALVLIAGAVGAGLTISKNLKHLAGAKTSPTKHLTDTSVPSVTVTSPFHDWVQFRGADGAFSIDVPKQGVADPGNDSNSGAVAVTVDDGPQTRIVVAWQVVPSSFDVRYPNDLLTASLAQFAQQADVQVTAPFFSTSPAGRRQLDARLSDASSQTGDAELFVQNGRVYFILLICNNADGNPTVYRHLLDSFSDPAKTPKSETS